MNPLVFYINFGNEGLERVVVESVLLIAGVNFYAVKVMKKLPVVEIPRLALVWAEAVVFQGWPSI